MKGKKQEGSSFLWSAKMRASGQSSHGCGKYQARDRIHISGAEGLYGSNEIPAVVRSYICRALAHPRGIPDQIIVTVERIKKKPLPISLLPVSTVRCRSLREAHTIIRTLLTLCSVSKKAISHGYGIVAGPGAMRGAALIRARSALREEPDRERGIRASMLGIEWGTGKAFSRSLSRWGINTETVKEAVVLASKVASCKGVLAELCISDDPDYTTGYVASRIFGYVRVPHIKKKGSKRGGRVFFIQEDADVTAIVEYLEERPVRAEKLSSVRGETTLYEIIGQYHS